MKNYHKKPPNALKSNLKKAVLFLWVMIGFSSCNTVQPSAQPSAISTTAKAPPTEIAAPPPSVNPTRAPTTTPDLSPPTPIPLPATTLPVIGVSSLTLVSPLAGASFSSASNPTFSWSSAGNLGALDYYQFQIRHSQGWDVICTKNTSSLARSYVPSLNPSQWTVNVVRLSSAVSNGSACSGSIIVASEVRGLSWSNRPSGVASPAANPPTAAPAPRQPTPTPCVPGPSNKC